MNVKFIFKIYQGGIAPPPSVFKTDAPIRATGTQAILSILQKSENVKFILRKLRKNVDFSELPFTGDIKYTTNVCECQIYFFSIRNPLIPSYQGAKCYTSVTLGMDRLSA